MKKVYLFKKAVTGISQILFALILFGIQSFVLKAQIPEYMGPGSNPAPVCEIQTLSNPTGCVTPPDPTMHPMAKYLPQRAICGYWLFMLGLMVMMQTKTWINGVVVGLPLSYPCTLTP